MKRKDAKLIKRFISVASVMILSSVLMGQPIANASAATVNSETVDTGISISTPGKTYYLVASGDTVYSIAKHFGETADNIKLWNELDENYSIYPDKILSIDGQNVYSTIDQETTAFTGDKQSFLNHILPIASDTAQTNGLYASVMMAQAMHESNYGTSELAKGSNNLFGIKGSYNGYSLIKKSWETNTDGTIVWSDAAFRLYPTIEDSIRDYGVRLRYGPTVESSSTSWNPDHYAGTWFENADTYLEAIQGLIDGGYATDPVYADKLKEKIAEHNLIQYDEQKAAELSPIQESTDVTLDEGLTETLSQTDTDSILSTKTTKYMAKITGGNMSLDTEPWGITGYQTVANSNDHLGKTVEVIEEKVTSRAIYAKFYLNGQFVWIEKVGLTPETMTNTKEITYTAKVVAGGHSIDSLPWGVEDFTTVAGTSEYLNQLVTVTKETETPRANWVLISQNGKELGWVDKNAVSALGDSMLSTKATSYMAQITGKNHSLDTLPWGMYGFQTVDSSNDHIGQTVEIVEERVTTRATWAKFYMNGQYVWMDKVGLTPETMTNNKDVNYEATIVAGGHSIDSLPWGVEGFVSIVGTSEYLNQTVTVTKEAQTPRANWALISYNGTILGWVDIKALQPKTQVKPVVFIDPGHGGSDPGAQYSGVSEKNINLIVSNKVKANLEALGYQVIMSRYTDESVGLLQRSIEANESGADIFVSIHHNAMPANATVTGIETYYYEYDPDYQPVINKEMHNDPTRILESAELASAIQDSVVEYTGALDRGVRRNTFAVLRETAIPAVLLELGYMSSPTELAKLTSTSYQTTLAKAITAGIVAYFE